MIQEIQISDIEIPGGRKLRTDVGALADSISQVGLLNPITVRATQIYEEAQHARDGYRLVAGLHRLEAMKSLGHETIRAHIIDFADDEFADLKVDLAEIDENLVRVDIPLIDQSERLENRKRIYEVLHPETSVGGDRKSLEFKEKNQSAIIAGCFTKDTAEKTGMSERSIQELTQISKKIGHDLKTEIRDTPLAYKHNELVKLARIKDHKKQRTAALAYISGEHDTIVVPKKRLPTKTERQQAGEDLAELLIEHMPADSWPQVCTYLKLDKATVTLSAFRKLQSAAAA